MPNRCPSFRPPRLRTKARPAGHNAHYLTPAWRALRLAILQRDRYSCCDCRRLVYGLAAQVDHITPRAEGGSDDPANLVTRCNACHARKTLEERRRRGEL
jgi:5-methylcytosine-specific restriction endonuclease McrA